MLTILRHMHKQQTIQGKDNTDAKRSDIIRSPKADHMQPLEKCLLI